MVTLEELEAYAADVQAGRATGPGLKPPPKKRTKPKRGRRPIFIEPFMFGLKMEKKKHEQLVRRSKKEGKTPSEIVRGLIEDYLGDVA